MAMFLVVGCQTTQSAETETKPEVVNEVKKLPKEKPDLSTLNPFVNKEIRPGQIVTSSKPIVCGRADAILNNVYTKFGEVPVFLGQSKAQHPVSGNEMNPMVTLTHNETTGTFTFFEQMPLEERLLCILSTGVGKFKPMTKGSSF